MLKGWAKRPPTRVSRWAMPGLNWRPLPCQGSALPLRQPPEVETGFEPVYTDLQSVASPLGHSTAWITLPGWSWERILRADDEIRTRDPHLGKVMLYQLSHVRMLLRGAPSRARLSDALRTLAHHFGGCQIGCDEDVFAATVAQLSSVHPDAPFPRRHAATRTKISPSSRIGESCATFSDRWGDWRSGSALRSHRRGRRFETAIAHRRRRRRVQ